MEILASSSGQVAKIGNTIILLVSLESAYSLNEGV